MHLIYPQPSRLLIDLTDNQLNKVHALIGRTLITLCDEEIVTFLLQNIVSDLTILTIFFPSISFSWVIPYYRTNCGNTTIIIVIALNADAAPQREKCHVFLHSIFSLKNVSKVLR
jgi:hypothetical protein